MEPVFNPADAIFAHYGSVGSKRFWQSYGTFCQRKNGIATAPITPNSHSQHSVMHLAAGLYTMLVGLVYLLPFLLNVRAQEVDNFLPNLFIGPPCALFGSSWVLLHLAEVGLPRWLSRTLALVNLLGVVLGSWLVSFAGGDGIRGLTFILWADGGILCVAGLFILKRYQQWRIGSKAALLAIAGAGGVFLVSLLFGSRYYAPGETVSSLPPYLDLPIVGLSIIVGIGMYWLGWNWNDDQRASTPPA